MNAQKNALEGNRYSDVVMESNGDLDTVHIYGLNGVLD